MAAAWHSHRQYIGLILPALVRQHYANAHHDVYERGIYVGTDPDANVRFELHRDADRGK
jgi:hypothetical protein